jgi:hypothetical protein
LLEHLLHVELGGLGLESDNGSHGVLGGAEAGLSGNSLVEHIGGGLLKGNGVLLDAEVLLVPLLGEVVAIVQEAVAGPNVDGLTTSKVLRSVVSHFSHVHVGVVGQDGGLGELLAAQKHVEGDTAVIGLLDFLDLESLVGQEEVESVEFVTTVVGSIGPHNGE